MPQSDEEIVVSQERTQSRKAEDHRVLYINSSRMNLSPWDIRMTLGVVAEGDEGVQVNEDLVTLLMSPQHAKAMLGIFVTTVALYEKTFGELPDTQNKIREVEAAKAVKATKAKAKKP